MWQREKECLRSLSPFLFVIFLFRLSNNWIVSSRQWMDSMGAMRWERNIGRLWRRSEGQYESIPKNNSDFRELNHDLLLSPALGLLIKLNPFPNKDEANINKSVLIELFQLSFYFHCCIHPRFKKHPNASCNIEFADVFQFDVGR